MKRFFVLAMMTLTALAAMAQSFETNIYSNGTRIFNQPTSSLDSIKMSNGAVHVGYNNMFWSRQANEIDSIVFCQIGAADTTQADTTIIDLANAIHITWNGNSASITNGYAGQGVDVTATGADVVITSTSSQSDLVYLLDGTSSNGSLTISSDKKLILCLDGLNMTNPNGAAINLTSDKRVLLHLTKGTASNLSDGAASSDKGAIQFKGKLDIQGSGTLNVSGLAKHAIQSSGKCNMIAGNVNVLTAVKDGLNVDDFVMDGGVLTITSLGDGIDGDAGMVEINRGHITITSPTADAKGITCDSTLTINGGTINVSMSGDQSKCLKSGMDTYVYGGTMTLNANGSVAMTASGNGYAPSYCTGIKSNQSVFMEGGEVTITCSTNNNGGKGINADGDVYLNNGRMTINALGGCSGYTNANGGSDSYSSTCVKSNGNIYANGGSYELNAGGKAIHADINFVQNGGTLTLTTNGNGAVTQGSGTNATDGYTSACVKAGRNIVVNGGRLTGTSTGKGGRGLRADNMTVGHLGDDDNLIDINIYTSGAPVNTTSGGGWGGSGSSTAWKGLPKGIKIDTAIVINSGKVSVYCSQTSGDPTAEAIESKRTIAIHGGEVEANSYDDAINAAIGIEITGGKVWAKARGNDGIDCNGTSGIIITGGLVIAEGTEVAIDADTERGGKFEIGGGTIIAKGGNMGCWDTPTCTGTQRYVTATVTPANGFCIKNSNGEEMLVFKAPTVSGSGFIDQTNGTGTKPPGGGGQNGGVGISLPGMVQGTYTAYSTVTISGGTDWHGYFEGATCTTSGNGTNVNTR